MPEDVWVILYNVGLSDGQYSADALIREDSRGKILPVFTTQQQALKFIAYQSKLRKRRFALANMLYEDCVATFVRGKVDFVAINPWHSEPWVLHPAN